MTQALPTTRDPDELLARIAQLQAENYSLSAKLEASKLLAASYEKRIERLTEERDELDEELEGLRDLAILLSTSSEKDAATPSPC